MPTSDRDRAGRFTSKTRSEKLTGVPDHGATFRALDFDWDTRVTPVGADLAAEWAAGYAAEVSE